MSYKTYKVTLSYGRKSPAFESSHQACDAVTAVRLSKHLAINCGFNNDIKKVTVKEVA